MWLLIWAGYAFSFLFLASSFIVATIDYFQRYRFNVAGAAPAHISWNVLKRIKPSLWVLILIYTCFYTALITFFFVGSDILQNTGYYNSRKIASSFMSIPFFVVILMNPYFSWLQNFHGRSLTFVSICAFATSIPFFGLLGNAYGISCFALYLQPIVSV